MSGQVAERLHLLDGGQLEILASALGDAIDYRDLRVNGGQCADCEAHPAALCDDHAADVNRADAYIVLGRELGIEPGR